MSLTDEIRVMLVDDHPMMRRGIQEVLEDTGGFEVVGLAADGSEAVELAEELRPDVIVMDVLMPDKDGIDACREILDLLPDTKVVMLTASTEEDAVIQAVAAGATGFVQKYSGSEELVQAIRRVAEGRLMVSEDAVKRVFELLRSGSRPLVGPAVLTARERDVISHFALGESYTRIAEALCISTTTVKNTFYRIQDKLGVETKQEAVVWAAQNGLLDADPTTEDIEP